MLNTTDAASGEYEVAAVRKALELLCEFTTAGTNLSVSELSRRLGCKTANRPDHGHGCDLRRATKLILKGGQFMTQRDHA